MFGVAPVTFAQDAAPTVDQYRAALQEATDRRLNIARNEFFVAQQQEEIATLQSAIEATDEDMGDQILPLVREMVAELEKAMVADLPFRIETRFALLDDLRADLQSDDASGYDMFRRAMELYGQEVSYGLQVGSYTGQNPVDPGGRYAACQQDVLSVACDLNDEQTLALETGAELEDIREQLYDGNFIHYGRLALMYLERDSSVGYRYNQATSSWDPVPASELLGLRQNVRIARGESAIATMTAPIRIGGGDAEAS